MFYRLYSVALLPCCALAAHHIICQSVHVIFCFMKMCVFCSVGTRNLAALGSLISWQRVAYDFSYHTQEFDCDVSVIALSDGKSILPVRYYVLPSMSGLSTAQASGFRGADFLPVTTVTHHTLARLASRRRAVPAFLWVLCLRCMGVDVLTRRYSPGRMSIAVRRHRIGQSINQISLHRETGRK